MGEQYRRPDLGDRRIAIVFIAGSFACGYVTTAVVDTAHWAPLFAVAPVALIAGSIRWLRRREDILQVVLPSIVIAYAGYVGIAAARVPPHDHHADGLLELLTSAVVDPFDQRWPIVAHGGGTGRVDPRHRIALPVSKSRAGTRSPMQMTLSGPSSPKGTHKTRPGRRSEVRSRKAESRETRRAEPGVPRHPPANGAAMTASGSLLLPAIGTFVVILGSADSALVQLRHMRAAIRSSR